MRTLLIAATVFFTVAQDQVGCFRGGGVLGAAEETNAARPAAVSTLNGLVGYWPFDEGEGHLAANLMGRDGDLFGKTGNAVMSPVTWVKGKFGQAVRFERTGPGMAVGYTEALDCDKAVTVAAWVKPEASQPQAGNIIWDYEYAYRLALDREGKNRVRFQLNLDGKYAGNWLLSKTSLQPGRWYHLAAVYDAKERRIYIDGELDASEPTTGTISRGTRMAIGGREFAGTIDELRVWNRPVSQAELKQVVLEDQAKVKAQLRPEHALRFYPVRCVGMVGKKEPIEITVFNSARSPFHGDVSVAVVSPRGTQVCSENPRFSIPTRGRMDVNVAFQPEQAGTYTLTIGSHGEELFQTSVYVLAPKPRHPVGELKLDRVVSVDLGQSFGQDVLCDDGTSRVVDSLMGRYREAGPGISSRFVVRATLRKTGLHLLRVKYPDDKARTCEITACSPADNDRWSAGTGYLTGYPYPVSNAFQTLDCILWARHTDQWVRFCTWSEGRPAAASSVEVFEIEDGLPASAASAGPGLRQIGLYWEDAQPLTSCFGGDGRSIEAFDRVVCNLCDYLDYTGQNVLFHPAVWYNGPIYNSLVEAKGIGKGYDGGRQFPTAAWMDILLKRFGERGFKFYAPFNVHDLSSLVASANTDIEKIKAGEPTFNAVTSAGKVSDRTWHHQPPAFNAIHPRVKERVLALVDELATRYSRSPAFGGIAFHLTQCQLLQFGGLQVSYDDWTISEFEKETRLNVPIEVKDPERFRKRYDWLMANAKEQWMKWRCEKIAAYYGEAARILRSKRPDLELVVSAWQPSQVYNELRERWAQGERLASLSREAGIDPSLIGRHPGVVMERNLEPTAYRWRLLRSDPKDEKDLLSIREMDFCEDQLKQYQTSERFGANFFNRYFENPSHMDRIKNNPVRSNWYTEPDWLGSAIVPGHQHFMEYYAHALALFDPTVITIGGFTVGTVGHERQVERFAGVFRLLPAGKWETIPNLGNKVVGRTLQVGEKRYLYLVSRSATEQGVSLGAAIAGQNMQPLGASPVLKRTEKGQEVALEPYQLAAWTSD